jgi:hypothetical protein
MSTARNRAANTLLYRDARHLQPSPENMLLYRERSINDSDFRRFVESVRENGVQEPLLVSLDDYIISGHQRQKAAIETGSYTVPVIYLSMSRKNYTEDEWVAVLREHNTGRQKSFDEMVREKLVDIDPDRAVAEIVDDRIERMRARVRTIEISEKAMKRCGISKAKQGMVAAILKVLDDLKDYLPVSLRAIHYRLLVESFWRNLKDKTPYQNDKASYKDLSDLATRMRFAEQISWDAITDETRPVMEWACWRNAADFVAERTEDFLCGYARDLLSSQQQHFEVVTEKLTVKNFVEPVAMKYCLPGVVIRGNSGIDARRKLFERFKCSGKRSLFLLCLGDCDPDGDSIVDSTLRSLRDDFGVSDVQGTRVAMTHQQADGLRLPQTLEAKKQSSNYAKFVAKHQRTDCYELEAVTPEVLQEWLDQAIRGVLDIEAYNHEVDEQKAEAAAITAKRQAVLEFMRRQ